ncbi:MAG: hypothetical protein JWM93_2455 [Frankiales bacterium]|nr:hypothetical protein [Frankiales bacterium]
MTSNMHLIERDRYDTTHGNTHSNWWFSRLPDGGVQISKNECRAEGDTGFERQVASLTLTRAEWDDAVARMTPDGETA